MTLTRNIFRIFLASPGDLAEERSAVREQVEEFNQTLAKHFGCHVDLDGWEDTGPAYGRPQELINSAVDNCDLFVGLLWKRWGTPPDGDGNYTSGFHEEFERSIARKRATGSPEIALFFKNVSKELVQDPGDELKKVLAFKTSEIENRRILFKTFDDVVEISKLIRNCIIENISSIHDLSKHANSEDVVSRVDESEAISSSSSEAIRENSPLSAEGHAFISTLSEILGHEGSSKEIEASHVARFRLLANLISLQGNDAQHVGVHDQNILFLAHSKGWEFGWEEYLLMLKLALRNIESENVPIWRWYSLMNKRAKGMLILISILARADEEKVGAIRALTLLQSDIGFPTKVYTRTNILESWFSEEASVEVRLAGLDYLEKVGLNEDIDFVKQECDRNDGGTLRKATACMAIILIRNGKAKESAELVLRSRSEVLQPEVTEAVIGHFVALSDDILAIGLEHRNTRIRLETLKTLNQRKAVDRSIAERLCQDSDCRVRFEAMLSLQQIGTPLSEREVGDILVPTGRQKSGGGLLQMSLNFRDQELGRDILTNYKVEKIWNLSEKELSNRVENSILYDVDAYFVRAERYFSKYGEDLRRAVDDQFQSYIKDERRRTQNVLGASVQTAKLLTESSELEEFRRKKLTRRGLDILCRAGGEDDSTRIRTNLRSEWAGMSPQDATFLTKFGSWSDISLLSEAVSGAVTSSSLPENQTGLLEKVSRALIILSRGQSDSALFSLNMNSIVLERVLKSLSGLRFLSISAETLLRLLHHESEEVRKIVAIKCVIHYSKKQISDFLDQYVGGEKYYYNVLHWLDLGASMPRALAKRIGQSMLK